MFYKYRALALLFLLAIAPNVAIAFEEGETKRSCFGLIWCRKQTEDSVSTDAFLYLYSHQRARESSRLAIRPFYSHEIDSQRNFIKRSVLWPLGTYELEEDSLWFHVFPFYWHAREPYSRFTLVPPLYLNYINEDKSYFHLFPVYGHHATGTFYDRYFILGPAFIATRDSQKDFYRWDIVYPLLGHRQEKAIETNWLFPVYYSKSNLPDNLTRLYVFPSYWNMETPNLNYRFLFPVFGLENMKAEQERRFSLIGLPPMAAIWPSIPTLSLYEHWTANDQVRDRFFPLYRYQKDMQKQDTQLSVLGYKEFSLFWQDVNQNFRKSHLFPAYSYEINRETNDSRLGILGYSELSLYRRTNFSSAISDRLFPVYDYEAGERARGLSVLGVSQLAIFRTESSPDLVHNHFFPVYNYSRDLAYAETHFNALFLYWHLEAPYLVSDRLFPFYDYERDKDTKTRQIGILGLLPYTLYEHGESPSVISDRFFPFYNYNHDLTSQEIQWDALFLYQHRQTPAYFKDAFLPLHHYENNHSLNVRSLSLFGIPPFTLFKYQQSAEQGLGYFFPMWSHRNDVKTGSRETGFLGYGSLSFYHRLSDSQGSSGHVFPVYGYKNSDSERRASILGFPPVGEFPALSFYEHQSDSHAVTDRFVPLYWFSRDEQQKESILNLFLLYNHFETGLGITDFLFPLYFYGKNDSEEESLVNLLLLYYHKTSPSVMKNGLLPIYHIAQDGARGESNFSAFGFEPLFPVSLFSQVSGRQTFSGHLFPVYNYKKNNENGSWHAGALGFSPVSLYYHSRSRTETVDRFFPVYSFLKNQTEKESGFALLGLPHWPGLPTFAIYEHRVTPEKISDRFFPVYAYSREPETAETKFNILSLFWYKKDSLESKNKLFPFYNYERDFTDDKLRFGILGMAPVSLYQHLRTSTKTSDRFFPFYLYSSDRTTGKAGLSVLWPLFDYKTVKGKSRQASLLWWLVHYEHSEEGKKEFRLLGGPAMAVLRREVTPKRSFFEFNPLIPFYYYEKEVDKGSQWDFLGGLIGMRRTDKQQKIKLFWIYL